MSLFYLHRHHSEEQRWEEGNKQFPGITALFSDTAGPKILSPLVGRELKLPGPPGTPTPSTVSHGVPACGNSEG